MAGNHQSVHVVDGTARGEDRIAFLEPDDVPHLTQAFMLHQDEHRGNLIREHVGVGGGGEPFTGHGHDIQAIGQLVDESGMS